MATRRKAVTRSRITTRSSKAKQPAATTASQTTTIITNTTTTTRLILLSSSSSSSETCSASSPVKKYSVDIKNEEDQHDEDGCCWSTPKAKRFRIPEIESCPPAPKKQRGAACDDDASSSINCSMRRRSSIPFFTPPELADFFFRVSVPNMSAAS